VTLATTTSECDDGVMAAERFEWVRCGRCGVGLWRRYPDRMEMSISPRGGQRRIITAPIEATAGLSVICEKCGARTTGSPDGTWTTLP
jgi:hypothetical protein